MTTNEVYQSPWKKPRLLTINKTKSIKRKPELIGEESKDGLNNSNSKLEGDECALGEENNTSLLNSATRKSFLNRFSINSGRTSEDLQDLSQSPSTVANEVCFFSFYFLLFSYNNINSKIISTYANKKAKRFIQFFQ
jgi:hypothetical protein